MYFQELEVLRTVIEGLETTEVNWIGTHEQPLVEDVKKLVEQVWKYQNNLAQALH